MAVVVVVVDSSSRDRPSTAGYASRAAGAAESRADRPCGRPQPGRAQCPSGASDRARARRVPGQPSASGSAHASSAAATTPSTTAAAATPPATATERGTV